MLWGGKGGLRRGESGGWEMVVGERTEAVESGSGGGPVSNPITLHVREAVGTG